MNNVGLSKTELAEFCGCSPATFRKKAKESGLTQALPKLTDHRATIYGADVIIIEQHLGSNPLLRKRFNLN